jgi:hypothetical protein
MGSGLKHSLFLNFARKRLTMGSGLKHSLFLNLARKRLCFRPDPRTS